MEDHGHHHEQGRQAVQAAPRLEQVRAGGGFDLGCLELCDVFQLGRPARGIVSHERDRRDRPSPQDADLNPSRPRLPEPGWKGHQGRQQAGAVGPGRGLLPALQLPQSLGQAGPQVLNFLKGRLHAPIVFPRADGIEVASDDPCHHDHGQACCGQGRDARAQLKRRVKHHQEGAEETCNHMDVEPSAHRAQVDAGVTPPHHVEQVGQNQRRADDSIELPDGPGRAESAKVRMVHACLQVLQVEVRAPIGECQRQ